MWWEWHLMYVQCWIDTSDSLTEKLFAKIFGKWFIRPRAFWFCVLHKFRVMMILCCKKTLNNSLKVGSNINIICEGSQTIKSLRKSFRVANCRAFNAILTQHTKECWLLHRKIARQTYTNTTYIYIHIPNFTQYLLNTHDERSLRYLCSY